MRVLSLFLLAIVSCGAARASEPVDVALSGRILFLGDSITHAGHYVSYLEAALAAEGADPMPAMIDVGLPSETCTGLSEPAHPFPRPDVHERLERALEKTDPDLVFACYGMNDGIYHPFSEERFAAYRAGIDALIEKVQASGAKLVLLTPPPFDPEPLRAKGKLQPADAESFAWFEIYEHYDRDVIATYAEWLLEQRDRVAGVIDLHSPVLAYTKEKRKDDPSFTLSNDGVHLNVEGHAVIARAILEALGRDSSRIDTIDPAAFERLETRRKILHLAWLDHIGHLRPGVKRGLPLAIAAVAGDLAAAGEAETLRPLFNGTDLSGWEGDEAIWSVEDGVLVGRNHEPVPSSTYLFTKSSHRTFRLLFEVRQTVSPGHSTMHSAVAVLGERFTDKGDNTFGFRGPLLMFCHDWGIWDAHRRNRVVPEGQKGRVILETERVGDWNLCEVLVTGDRIRFAANGALVFDFTDDPSLLRESPIGLQVHSNDRPQEYRFRGLVLSDNPTEHLLTLTSDPRDPPPNPHVSPFFSC